MPMLSSSLYIFDKKRLGLSSIQTFSMQRMVHFLWSADREKDSSRKMTIVELCVHMDCSGCESRIRKALQKLEGVDDVEIDMARQKVTVTGYVDQKKVLKAARKSGRRAVLWTFPYNPAADANGTFNQHYNHQQHHHQAAPPTFTANPFAYSTASSSSYNYNKHGYDDSIMRGYYQMPTSTHGHVVGDRTGAMFSDDNPNACSVM